MRPDTLLLTGSVAHVLRCTLRDFAGSPGVSGNVIGGTVAGAGNTIANNGTAGTPITPAIEWAKKAVALGAGETASQNRTISKT